MSKRKRRIAFETLVSPERSNYFTGKMLSAEDLAREQDYFRNKIRLALRLAHGWGVVSGLQVSVSQGDVVVSPGVAVDCRGQDLVLPRERRLSLAGVRGTRYVTIRFDEVPIEPVPVLGENEALVSHAATRETVHVELATIDPLHGHGMFKPRDGGCGTGHALSLAAIRRVGKKWKVAATRGLRE